MLKTSVRSDYSFDGKGSGILWHDIKQQQNKITTDGVCCMNEGGDSQI